MSNFPFTSLLCEEEILRFYPASLEEGIPLTAFELSTQEKEPGSAGGTSAWALSKTTPEQAFAIRGRSERRDYLTIEVGDIRAAASLCNQEIEDGGEIKADVKWVPVQRNLRDLPGSEGHVEIFGLQRPPSAPKKKYKRLRELMRGFARQQFLDI